MHASLPILLAAGLNEIISVLVGLAFFVIWVINQINDAKKKQAAKEQQLPNDVPLEPIEQPAAAGGAPPADPLRTQVDEFLRRAGRQPGNVPPGAPQRPPRKVAGRDEIVVLLDESVAPPPRKTLAEKMRAQIDAADIRRAKPTASQRPREAKPRSPERSTKRQPSKSVAEYVAERAGATSQEFREEVADLGARVKQADEQFDRQLEQKFDHGLGQLPQPTSAGGVASKTAEPTPAAQIAAMLANPDGVRQAMILNEVLTRPSDRW